MRGWAALAPLLAAPLLAAASEGELRLAPAETVVLERPAATAALAVDPSIVEASVLGGEVTLVGRHVGRTVVTVIAPAAVETLIVRVEAPAARALAAPGGRERPVGVWDGRYDSATGRLSSGLSATLADGERSADLRLFGIHESGGGAGDDVQALPSASLALAAPGRSLVLLDELVQETPLTLDGSLVRGLHLRQGPLTLHAGIASATPWDDLLLPSRGDRALGLSYRADRGGFALLPSLVWLPDADDADAGAEVPGVAALALLRGGDGDRLRLLAEIGWSGEPGAALDLAYRGPRHHGWLQGEHRPAGFAALGVAQPPGSFLDGAWSGRLGARTTAHATLSASRLDLAGHRQEAGDGRFELRLQAGPRWTWTGGLSAGGFRDRDGSDPTLRRGTASLGAAYDAPAFGLSGLYRYQDVSAASRGGHGGRWSVRGSRGGWRAHLYVDAQEDAPTVSLIFRDRPDLARAFAELGFVAGTPEEVLRLLRDSAALLAERGVVVGPLELDPLRVQGGLDVAWRPPGPRRTELRLRLAIDEAHGVAATRRAHLGTLSASRRIFGDTDLLVGYTRWSIEHGGGRGDERGSLEVALRTGLTGFVLPGGGRRPITGRVVLDAGATGMLDDSLPGLAGVEVVLDGGRRARTDSAGRFSFSAPGPGEHRVEAALPGPGAYFTRPSVASLPAGGEARFAVTFSASRLSGTVRSDAGVPRPGVTLRLAGPAEATATTDSSGAYRFDAPAGLATVTLVADSLPPGYDLVDLAPVERRLAPGAPAVADFVVRAQRVLEGVVIGGAGGETTVAALEAGRTVSPDETGRFLLRGLPAGPLTLVVRGPRGETRRVIEVPAEPGTVKGVELVVP